MTSADAPASLAAALAQLQTQLPSVRKTRKARVKGKTKAGLDIEYSYKYCDLADVSATLMPLMGPLGLAFTCQPTVRDDGRFGLAYQLLHSSGESLGGFYPLDPTLPPQQLGSAITYGRRYCLTAVTGVASEEDTDARGIAGPGSQRSAPRTQRGAPPIRPLEELPRNQDGSLSRGRCTEAELQHYGAMDSARQRQHNALERLVLGTDPEGKSAPSTERASAAPPDDSFYDAPQGGLRTPQPAGSPVAVIHQHFKRLGYSDSPEDRTARLSKLSAITGREIKSTNDLSAAEGVKVIRLLKECGDLAALDEALAAKAGTDG
jgi:hypothetical protein